MHPSFCFMFIEECRIGEKSHYMNFRSPNAAAPGSILHEGLNETGNMPHALAPPSHDYCMPAAPNTGEKKCIFKSEKGGTTTKRKRTTDIF